MKSHSTKKKLNKERPSAVDDCADITSKYERYKNHNKKPQFTPVKHEKPPHY